MVRSSDPVDEARYYRFVRYAKAAVGIIFAMGAFLVAVLGDGGVGTRWDHITHLSTVLGLALVSGLMFDAPTVTRVIATVLEALPWTPSAPNPGGTDGHVRPTDPPR